MPTVPIPARRVVTTFDSASKHERIEAKPPLVRLFRHAVSTVFNLWMRVSTPVVEQLGWYDQIEPYVGYGTEAYSRLICRTVYAPEHHRPGARIRGIWGMLAIPAPHRRVRVAIDGTPLETVQVGTSESYDKPDAKRRQTAEYAVSDSAGYLDLVAEHRLSPGIHRVSYRGRPPQAGHRQPVHHPQWLQGRHHLRRGRHHHDQRSARLWKAAYNVLFANPKKRASVPGMSVLFTKLAALFPEAPFFYLSTSPWNVESSIRHFINDHGFPAGPLLLRDLDPRPKTFIPTGVQHKLEFAEQLMGDFPDMKFILIGDDGQKDPTTYATIARRYPGRVIAIGIRQLSPREASPLGSVAGVSATQPMPVTDVPVFTGTTGANLMKTMLPYLERFA